MSSNFEEVIAAYKEFYDNSIQAIKDNLQIEYTVNFQYIL